ncbi:polymeric immunoglobulin receptor [Microcebus murinus]|uniref:polymeric immunoglobulin receptor n=1 Tax=Microcebus murinus TaxID=30608 RepID=UPI003F6BF95A
MTPFLLACLLAAFPAVSTKSPIFGPQQVRGVEGKSVSITCFYPPTSVNRHTRKYWCRQGASGPCTTLISSEGYVSSNYVGRARLTNFPENGTFVVDIAQLFRNDSGRYKCGLGLNSRGLSFDVSLEVSQDPGLLKDTDVYTVDVGRTVTIKCPLTSTNGHLKRSLCKWRGQHCVTVIDTNYVSSEYGGRISLPIQGTDQSTFSVIIKQLRLSDAGKYTCKVGEGPTAEMKNVDLQVLEPVPELVYGDLRGSVSFDCAPGPEAANVAKFLCRVTKGESCDVVINTLGQRDSSFEGRILLTPRDQGRLFNVLITGLRKEDAGRYVCGAHSDGVLQDGWPIQAWQLFVNEETTIPQSPSVVKGVTGGSVSVLCPYNPKEGSASKYWCRWDGAESSGRCPLLVESQGLVKEQYKGRLVLHEEPGNGTYTVILNQLTAKDAGFYWCLTNRDIRWRTSMELKVIEGKPNLKVPENVTAVLGGSLKLPCHFPCKFYSHEKYWCKWSNSGCQALPTQDEGPSQAFVNCDQNSKVISLTLNQVTKADEGWYWCGVKEGQLYGETAAVYVAVEEKVQGSRSGSPENANVPPGEDLLEASASETENRAVQGPRLFAEERVVEDVEDQAEGSRASADASGSEGQGGSSKVLLSTLVPLGLVLALGAVAVGVARARHRKNVDRVSIASYRTNISMSDFENSREFGANDNMGASPVTQETSLEGKDELSTTNESTTETGEPKKAKRSSKEEAEMAYSAFLLQASNVATEAQDKPVEV